MLHTRFTAMAVALLTVTATLHQTAEATTLSQQRAVYQDARAQLKKGNTKAYFQLKARLTDYPLYPYLQQLELEQNFSQINQHQIDLYAEQYQGLPTNFILQRRWLNHLANSKQWSRYLLAYDKTDIRNEKFLCLRHQALLRTGQARQALSGVESLWNQGHSVSSHCDPVFKHWIKKAEGPSSTLAYQRFWKAVENNEIKLARYLQKFIKDKQQRSDTQLFFSLRQKPELLLENKKLLAHTPAAAPLYIYALERLSRTSPVQAAEYWLKVRDQLTISDAKTIKQNRAISKRLIRRNDEKSHTLLNLLNKPFDNEIQDRRILQALTLQDWQQVYSLINELDAEQQASEAKIYWKTIAASHIRGLKPAYSEAFVDLSKQRSYYGLLAARVLETRFHLNPEQKRIPAQHLQSFREQPTVLRMQELYHLNELYLARREWNQYTREMPADQLRTLSTVVQEWGWYSLAIRGAAVSKYWDDISLRFPMPYGAIFSTRAREFKIDTNWARAIARQESAYLTSARSSVGARGLMQLMPRTAKATARKNKVSYRRVSELNKPELNINLGVAYLAEMQKRFKDNQIHATAAYNAGPHRVDRWLKERGELPIDIWIETIPFRETRKYVMSVMAYHAIYQTLAGQPAHIMPRQTAFRLAMKDTTGVSQSKHLRSFIKQNPGILETTQTQ
ncbi:MAG: transglycosylase SLT domain-containing protein [Amphritea sp.]|nr:transglycosylase SLT domain-containing protein [Amphritea sp.]